jgi:Lrp/AsnC family leucine-responsive transcriptional regulator
MSQIDKTDRRILTILQMDGRIAAVELADKVGLSPTFTGERLKRLQREGYVAGFGARLDPHKLDLGFLVFVEVLLDKDDAGCF